MHSIGAGRTKRWTVAKGNFPGGNHLVTVYWDVVEKFCLRCNCCLDTN